MSLSEYAHLVGELYRGKARAPRGKTKEARHTHIFCDVEHLSGVQALRTFERGVLSWRCTLCAMRPMLSFTQSDHQV